MRTACAGNTEVIHGDIKLTFALDVAIQLTDDNRIWRCNDRVANIAMRNDPVASSARRKRGELTRDARSQARLRAVLIKRINHGRFINERREIILSCGAERARKDRSDGGTSIALIIPTIPLRN